MPWLKLKKQSLRRHFVIMQFLLAHLIRYVEYNVCMLAISDMMARSTVGNIVVAALCTNFIEI